MATVDPGQIIDKTLFLKKEANFYRGSDICKACNADKAKPVGNKLPKGYSFKVDSFLSEYLKKKHENLGFP